MYIKVKDRELFRKLDEALVLPKYWNEFVKEQSLKHRLIIKNKKIYECPNCHNKFQDTAKANEECICPDCKNKYLVKTNKLTRYEFKSDLAILDRYNDYYIVRAFRLITDYKNGKYKSYYFEYARFIYDDNFHLVEKIINDNVVGTISGYFVSYRKSFSTNWRYFIYYGLYLPDQYMYYSYNLKEMLSELKGLKYSMLWDLVKYVDCDLIYLITNYNPSIEILTKLKLYNLALCPKTFRGKKSFQKRFKGITKDYLPFIQKYNLDIDELTILSYIKIKDIKYIKPLVGLSEEQIKSLIKKVNIKLLVDRTNFNAQLYFEYRDYLEMAKKMKLNLKDKNILYPKNIKKSHDLLQEQYDKVKDEMLNKAIQKQCKKILKNTFKNERFIIFPASNIDALIDESSQQHNCVRTYAERIACGECQIYFMRLVKDREHSLVTVEVKNNHVVQKRTKNNQTTTKTQDKFLELWEKEKLNGGAI